VGSASQAAYYAKQYASASQETDARRETDAQTWPNPASKYPTITLAQKGVYARCTNTHAVPVAQGVCQGCTQTRVVRQAITQTTRAGGGHNQDAQNPDAAVLMMCVSTKSPTRTKHCSTKRLMHLLYIEHRQGPCRCSYQQLEPQPFSNSTDPTTQPSSWINA
jgi:hypothetical protein